MKSIKELDERIMNYLTHRVLKKGNLPYRAIKIPVEILEERRAYLREILGDTKRFRDATDEELDNSFIRPNGDHYVAEDWKGYTCHVPAADSQVRGISRSERSLIPLEYQKDTISCFDWKIYGDENMNQQKTTLNRFILRYPDFAKEGMGLYIFSNTKGSGKTMLACILLNEIGSRHDINTKFVTSTDYLNMTKKSYKGSEDDVNMVRKAGLLVVDDIGTQISRDWIDTTFYELVNYRYNNHLPTIFTSNIPVEKLKMDERITDRIERKTMLVKLPEKNIRYQKGLEEKRRFQASVGM